MYSLTDRFYFALAKSNIASINALIEEGFDINEHTNYGYPIVSAIMCANYEIITRLIPLSHKINPLLYVVKEEKLNSREKIEIIELILSIHDINITDKDNKNALLLMLENCDVNKEIIKLLINNKQFNFRNRDRFGNNALMYACCFGIDFSNISEGKSFIEFLIERIPINEKNNIGQTALHLAVCSEEDDIVLTLLKNNSSIHIKDKKGKKAKDYAEESSIIYPYL